MLDSQNLKYEILENDKEDELRFNNNLKIYFDYKNDLIRLNYKTASGKNAIITFMLTYIKCIEYSYTAPYILKGNCSKKLQINSIKKSIEFISPAEQKLFYENDKSCNLKQFISFISTKIKI